MGRGNCGGGTLRTQKGHTRVHGCVSRKAIAQLRRGGVGSSREMQVASVIPPVYGEGASMGAEKGCLKGELRGTNVLRLRSGRRVPRCTSAMHKGRGGTSDGQEATVGCDGGGATAMRRGTRGAGDRRRRVGAGASAARMGRGGGLLVADPASPASADWRLDHGWR